MQEPAYPLPVPPRSGLRIRLAGVSLFPGILAAAAFATWYLLAWAITDLRRSLELTKPLWVNRLKTVASGRNLLFYPIAGIFGVLATIFNEE